MVISTELFIGSAEIHKILNWYCGEILIANCMIYNALETSQLPCI